MNVNIHGDRLSAALEGSDRDDLVLLPSAQLIFDGLVERYREQWGMEIPRTSEDPGYAELQLMKKLVLVGFEVGYHYQTAQLSS